jgi:hypothetical protein
MSHINKRNGPGPKSRGPGAPPGGAGSVNWTPIGPSALANGVATGSPPVSGIVSAIAVGGTNEMRVYVGTAYGGVWLSTDGALTWTPLLDQQVSASYTSGVDGDVQAGGALAVRFGSPDLVFVGTRVGIFSASVSGLPPPAVNWSAEATNLIGQLIFRIVIDPDDPSKVFAACQNGLFRRPPSPGPYTDWPFVFNPTGYPATDLVIAGSGASKKYYAAFPNGGVYVSTGFSSWTVVPGYSAAGTQRIALAVADSDSTVVYAFDDKATLCRLNSGTFQNVASVPASVLGTVQLTNVIGVDPSNAITVYLGGSAIGSDAALFKGTLTGGPGTWTFPFTNTMNPAADPTWIGQGIHPDLRSFAFANTSPTVHDGQNVLVGCDGGLFQSVGVVAAKGTFVQRNLGLSTLLTSRLAQRPDTDAVVFGGQRDNGVFRLWGEQAGYAVQGGDGGGVAIDPNDPYNMMCLLNGGFAFSTILLRSNDGGVANWSSANFPPTGDNNECQKAFMSSPIAVSPSGVSPTLAAFGTNRLWVTKSWGDAGTWVTLPTNTNPYIPSPPNYAQDALDGVVTAIAIASATRVFVSTFKSVYRFDLSGGVWSPSPPTPISMIGTPANRTIGSIAVDDPVAGSLYMVLSGSGYDHVWYFNGSAWASTGLPQSTLDVPARAIAVDPANPPTPAPATPQFVYVGTSVGVWKGMRTGATTWSWSLFSQGLPEADVEDLAVHARTRLLRAALSGRGVWEIPLDAATGTDPDIYLRANYADTGHVVDGTRYPWVEGAADPTAKGFNVYHWMSADIKVYRSSLGSPKFTGQPGYLDFAFNIGDWIDSTTHIETADQSGMDRIFVEVHNRGLTPLPAGQVRVCLLLTTVGAAGVPLLPAGYANSINTADTTNWLKDPVTGIQNWHFAELTKYKVTTGVLDVRTPQVVEFDLDFSLIGLTPGDHVCAAAFVTTVGGQDQLPMPGNTNLDQLTMQDKHVAQRNLHLVLGGVKPIPPPGRGFLHEPQTFLIDFHNATPRAMELDLVFQRPHFPGELSVMLPAIREKAAPGFNVIRHDGIKTRLREHLGSFLERVGERVERAGEAIEQFGAALTGAPSPADDVAEQKRRRLASLDRSRIFVAAAGVPAIEGVKLEACSFITVAVTVQAPATAKPGDRFRFDILQKSGGRIVGGSSYVMAVVRSKTR